MSEPKWGNFSVEGEDFRIEVGPSDDASWRGTPKPEELEKLRAAQGKSGRVRIDGTDHSVSASGWEVTAAGELEVGAPVDDVFLEEPIEY